MLSNLIKKYRLTTRAMAPLAAMAVPIPIKIPTPAVMAANIGIDYRTGYLRRCP